jgi:hypothetical protein
VLTHTRPWPPPAAGGLVAVSVLVLFAGAPLTAVGLAAAELFGLNKSPSENLEGDGDAAALAAVPASAFFRPRLALGEASGDAAGEAEAAASVASVFLRVRFAWGDAAGEGEVAASVDDAVVSAFLCVRCFAGEGAPAGDSPGAGDWASMA